MRNTLLFLTICCPYFSIAQKTVTDCTINYTVSAVKKNANADPSSLDIYNGTTVTLFLKGVNSRIETSTPLGNITFIYNSSTESGVRLRENGANKFLEKYDKAKLALENKKFEGAKFIKDTTTKEIAGYKCNQGTVLLTNGLKIKIFYTIDVQALNTNFDFQFSLVPGFVLEYIRETDEAIITNTATKCSLSPVPASKFEVPKTGYREIVK